jgi:hypothetical protein
VDNPQANKKAEDDQPSAFRHVLRKGLNRRVPFFYRSKAEGKVVDKPTYSLRPSTAF